MSHLTAFKKQLHAAIDRCAQERELARAERRLATLTREADAACSRRASLPAGSSRAQVTTANARWARKAEARDLAARQVEALRTGL